MNLYKATDPIHLILHPFSLLAFALGKKDRVHEIILKKAARKIWKDEQILKEFSLALDELKKGDLVPRNANSNSPKLAGNSLGTTFGKWIYCTVRATKPEVMIETGVSHGASSWIILNAMRKNGKGTLYSIDLPNLDTNALYNFKSGQEKTGWMVPEELRSRWELILGDARIELPALLQRLKSIDIFFHDSDHSYEHMKFEFETVFPYLKTGGVLLSDDVDKNNSFSEFITACGLNAIEFNKGGCAIRALLK